MDPLSIIASSMAIATPIAIGLRKIRDTRGPKLELTLLAEEIDELVALLEDLDVALRSQSIFIQCQLNTRMLQVLVAVKVKLTDLSFEMANWSSSTSNRPTAKHRPVVWTQISTKIKSFKDDLGRIRFQLLTMLSMKNLYGTPKTEMTMQDVLTLTRDMASGRSLAQQDFQTSMAQNRNQLHAVLQHITANSNDLSSEIPAINPPRSSEALPTPEDVESGSQVKAFHRNGSMLFESSKLTAMTAVGIRTAQFPRSSCTPWCSCICHKEFRFRSPQCLDRLIGGLTINSSGIPMLHSPCNESMCHLRTQPLTYVNYFFPTWFIPRMITFMLAFTPLAGPVASLKVQRTIPGSADIFNFAKLGDVDGIKSLFNRGLASPHDVSCESGITPLHMTVNHQRLAVCEFLLQANTDPFLADYTNCTAADSAWTKMFSGCLTPVAEQAMRNMFAETECIERRGFTVIPKIVLGLLENDLEQELQASTASINVQDSIGRTALSIAAERSRPDHVSTLLKYKADPTLASFSEHNPLHYAAMAKEANCIELLLQRTLEVDSVTDWLQTPLHLAAAYGRTTAHAELLLDAGADPNRRDRDGMTPLSWTAISNNLSVARVLLNRANIQVHDLDLNGSSTVCQSIQSNRHEILGPFAPHRPVLKSCFRDSNTILGLIAANADVETLNIIKDYDFVGLESNVRDVTLLLEYLTLLRRPDSTSELVQAFRNLLLYTGVADTDTTDIDEDEIWTDASENIT